MCFNLVLGGCMDKKAIENKIAVEKMIEIEDLKILFGISYPTARKYLKTLTEKKVLKEIQLGKKKRYYILQDGNIYDIIGKNL